MREFFIFSKKEWMEGIRSSKLLIFLILFVLFGIMNPAMAKLTPWMMELAAESMEGSGLIVTEVEVTALTSWEQYFKNVPILMLVFFIMFSGIFTHEYEKGTLINVIAKGVGRTGIMLAKTVFVFCVWTAGTFLCFLITYGYNAYFWDNDIAKHPMFAAFCFYALGVWLISVLVLASVVASNNITVALLTGIAFAISYVLGMLPNIKEFLPTHLLSASSLNYGGEIQEYGMTLVISLALVVVNILVSSVIINKRSL